MTEKICFISQGFRELSQKESINVGSLTKNGEPLKDFLSMKVDGFGIVKGKQTEIQIQYVFDKLEAMILRDELNAWYKNYQESKTK